MNRHTKVSNEQNSNLPKDSFNADLTARPQDTASADEFAANPDTAEDSQLDYGDLNLKDAQESGYTDKNGNAISKAKPDVVGSPTGAYTDIGAGRSSAVNPKIHHSHDKDTKH